MSKFTIEINTDSAAFEDFGGLEISRILSELGKKLEQELTLEQGGQSLLI